MTSCAELLRLLADETRLRILHLLECEPMTVAELTEILNLGQSSISGHLAKLKRAGLIHDLAEGSAHRYRLRDDAPADLFAAWRAAKELSAKEPALAADRLTQHRLRTSRGSDWVERVAGLLHREYAPGRTWEALAHTFIGAAQLGRCLDIGAGDGSLAGLIAPSATHLTCVDPAPAMIEAGRARCKELGLANVSWLQATGEALPLPNSSQDTVLLLQSLQYVEKPAEVLATCGKVLAPGGRLLVLTLTDHQHDEAARFGHRHRGFSEANLRRWVSSWCSEPRVVRLPPEARAPRFQSLILVANK